MILCAFVILQMEEILALQTKVRELIVVLGRVGASTRGASAGLSGTARGTGVGSLEPSH